MAETIIIDINVGRAIEDVQRAKKALEDLKKQREDLTKAVEEGTLSQEEATKATLAYDSAIRLQSKEVQGLNRILDNTVKQRKAEKGSIEANRAELSRLTAEYIKLGKPTVEQTARIKQLSDTLKEQEAQIGDTRRNVGNYKSVLDALPGGLKNTITGVQGFNTALKANPIGAVVGLLLQFAQQLQSNAKIADGVTNVIAGLNKGFGVIIDTIVTTVSSFDNLGKALLNPVKFFKDLVVGVADAAVEGYNASKAFDELVVSQAKVNASIKENLVQVTALEKSLKDRTKTEQERIAIANKVADLEIENSKLAVELANQELQAEQLRLKGRTLAAEEEAKLIELTSNVRQAESEADIARNERTTRINILLAKEEAAAKKEEKKKDVKTQEEINAELEKIQSAKLQKDLQAIQFESQERKNALLKRLNEGEITQKEFDEKLKQNEINALQERLAVLQFYGEEVQQTELDIQTRMLENQKLFNEQQLKEQQEQNEKQKEEYQKDQDNYIATQQAKLAVANSTVSALNSLLNILAAAGVESAAFQKTLALTQIAIDTARSISAGIAGATTSATATGPGAFVATPVFIATTIATILGAVAQATAILKKVQTPEKPSFAEGVIGLQGAGTETSDSIPANLSKGESVLTAKATKRFAPVLAQMEMSVGNKPNYQFKDGRFAGGFISDGGFAGRTFGQGVNNSVQVSELTREVIANLPPSVLLISELNRVLRSQAQTAKVSEL